MSLLRQALRSYIAASSPSIRLVKKGLVRLRREHLSDASFDLCLDVGGGLSRYREIFGPRRFFSIDIAPRDNTHLCGDIRALPLRDDCVDLVLCTEVLEHVYETSEALAEIYRVLRPGGYAVITVPLLYGEHDHADFHRWTRLGMRTALGDAGFDVVDVASRGGLFGTAAVLLSLFPEVVVPPPSDSWASRARPRDLARLAARLVTGAPFLAAGAVLEQLDPLDRAKRHSPGLVALGRKNA